MKHISFKLGIVLVVFIMIDVLLTYSETHGLKESDAELLYFVLSLIFLIIAFLLVRRQNLSTNRQIALIIISFLLFWGGTYALNWFVLLRLFTNN